MAWNYKALAKQAQQPPANVHKRDTSVYRNAIASIESAGSGDYQAIGVKNAKLGRPLGRYQVMEKNLASWSKEALGKSISVEEFLANPEAQDAVFDHKFGQYIEKFGSPIKASQAWFGGPGAVGSTGRKDVLGTSVGQYARKFANAVRGQTGGSTEMLANADGSMPDFNLLPVDDMEMSTVDMDAGGEEPSVDPIEEEEKTLASVLGLKDVEWDNLFGEMDGTAISEYAKENKEDILAMIMNGVEAQTSGSFLPGLPGFPGVTFGDT